MSIAPTKTYLQDSVLQPLNRALIGYILIFNFKLCWLNTIFIKVISLRHKKKQNKFSVISNNRIKNIFFYSINKIIINFVSPYALVRS